MIEYGLYKVMSVMELRQWSCLAQVNLIKSPVLQLKLPTGVFNKAGSVQVTFADFVDAYDISLTSHCLSPVISFQKKCFWDLTAAAAAAVAPAALFATIADTTCSCRHKVNKSAVQSTSAGICA